MIIILGMGCLPYYGSSVLDKISFSPKASQTVDEIADEFEDIGKDDKVFDKDYLEKHDIDDDEFLNVFQDDEEK